MRPHLIRCLVPLLLAALLAACAPLTPTPPPASTEKRYTSAELLALKPGDFQWPATTTSGEQALRERALAELRAGAALPPGPARDAALPALLETAAVFNAEVDTLRPLLLEVLPRLGGQDPEFQRAVLTAAHTFYAREAAPLLWPLLPDLRSTKPFAIAAYTLLQADAGAAERLRGTVPQLFPAWADDARLVALMQRLQPSADAPPPLADLLSAPIRPGFPVVFSLQRPGREVMGLALVRGADGRFVREASGGLFSQPQLARALTRLPGTLTNGNTPQGLFTLVGAGTATNRWIGPTPYLHTKLPIEATTAEFEHADTAAVWSADVYASFLPPSWRGWLPIQEAWLAGRAGRDEILMHGTVVNPAYYRGTSYFPGTPSAGCMVSHEVWDTATGRLQRSGQLRLAQTYAAASPRADLAGYLVVVEVPGEGPVTPAEAETWVQAAGR